ncbi:methylated-DNA--[protein]-cysteine S-methyltransferase [Maribacter dokdonensis]|uniref:methylated-DNA--[protein]-cysteine S-methyltransferase n=1 Tax=Maribacter dokdonensis TaxID=320912 RepID=UPI000719985F|nr:methylated-DNA--[protein]-cysteine S-methyltransferase [Maribacter dokdonensis]KSA12683.1 Methylated-DNA-protein-cysteine S-methyltransferase [Maribacter dokdonensis DSW-8]
MEDIAYIKTPLGVAKIVGDAEGVSAITVLNFDEPLTDVIPESLEDAVFQLNEYFEGARTEFNLTLNPVGTEFQKKVWVELQNIPYGKSKSYLELAKALGDPNATRAAASANARNPLWIVVPCHRVIGTDGSLTGYAGGLHRKQWLLNHESPVKQQSLF